MTAWWVGRQLTKFDTAFLRQENVSSLNISMDPIVRMKVG